MLSIFSISKISCAFDSDICTCKPSISLFAFSSKVLMSATSFVEIVSLIFLISFGLNAIEKKPNILFAVADDMSHASAYGYKFLKTPN